MDKRKLTISLIVLFAVNILLITAFQLHQRARAASYSTGSTGQVVVQIQKRLSEWGYYTGSADGIYGPLTKKAVTAFQKKNGLTADGVAGPATLAAIGISGGTTKNANVALLARLISAEARGEPYSGQVAVGAVVLNRVEHPSFPSSISGVIYQSGAFSCLYDGQFDKPVADSAYRAAADAMNGWDPTGGAIYYYNPNTATNSWIRTRPVMARIGGHVFCR